MMSSAVALHVLGAVLWVGGMFFAYQVLRPAVGPLDPPVRLALWSRVFRTFFGWVWVSVVALLASGYWLVFVGYGGFGKLPVIYHLMHGIGLLMVALFLHLWFAPYARFRRALAASDWPGAGTQIDGIRRTVAVNLILGLINVVIGAGGRYLG